MQNHKNKKRIQLNNINSSLFSLFVVFFASFLQAEETVPGEGGIVLEEVFVSARKRSENQAEVPISITVLGGQQMAERGVEKIEDLTQNLTGLRFLETGVTTQLSVRGVGSAGNQGFEQSVGMYVDGVHHGRATLFRMPLFDLERVELLRGPQNILFGKNAIAGALNIQSARPTENAEIDLNYRHDPEFALGEWSLAGSAALTDDFRVRLALRQYDEEGFLYNHWLGEDGVQREESSFRVSAEWDASSQLDFYLKLEQHDLQAQGRNALITHDEALEGGLTYAETLQLLSYFPFDVEQKYSRVTNSEDSSEGKIDNATLVGTYDFGSFRLQSTTAILNFETDELCDCDFVSAEIINLSLQEKYEQFSQEVRLEGNTSGVEWQAGVYFQSFDQEFSDLVAAYENNFLLLEIPEISNTGIAREFDQQADSWAAFASASWMLTDTMQLTVGGRYTQENKTADKRIDIINLQDNSVVSDPVVAYRYLSIFQIENEQAIVAADPELPRSLWAPLNYSGHNLQAERDEDAFSPNVVIEWLPDTASRYYLSWSLGNKSGGFDPRSNRVGTFSTPNTTEEPNPHLHFEFEDEKVNAIELGNKRSVLGGRAEIHTAVFHSQFEDLQTSQFDGGSGFVVGNVAGLTVQGIEIEGRWYIQNNLNMHYALAYLDAEYDDFDNANCYAGQTPDGRDFDGDGNADTCDASGQRPAFTPEVTLNLGLDYRVDIVADWQARFFFFGQYASKQLVNANLDPVAWQDPVTLLNLRASLHYGDFYLAMLAKNLLDEYQISNSDGLPLAELEFQSNTQAGWLQRPRSVAFELGLRF